MLRVSRALQIRETAVQTAWLCQLSLNQQTTKFITVMKEWKILLNNWTTSTSIIKYHMGIFNAVILFYFLRKFQNKISGWETSPGNLILHLQKYQLTPSQSCVQGLGEKWLNHFVNAQPCMPETAFKNEDSCTFMPLVIVLPYGSTCLLMSLLETMLKLFVFIFRTDTCPRFTVE